MATNRTVGPAQKYSKHHQHIKLCLALFSGSFEIARAILRYKQTDLIDFRVDLYKLLIKETFTLLIPRLKSEESAEWLSSLNCGDFGPQKEADRPREQIERALMLRESCWQYRITDFFMLNSYPHRIVNY